MSVEIRLLILAICIILLALKRSGYFEKRKENQKKKEVEEAKEKRKAMMKERRQKALEQKERKDQQTAEILRRVVPGMQQKSVTVAGADVFYLDSGPRGDAPTALLLHSFGGDKENWGGFAKSLIDKGYRAVAPDLPGWGQNPKNPDISYDVMQQTKRVRAFAHKLGLKSFHLVGCGMGATISAAWAYGASSEVLTLTLIEPFGVGVPYPSELDEWLAQDRNPMVITTPAAYDNLLGFLYHQTPDIPEKIKNYRAEQISRHRALYQKIWMEVCHGERAKLLDLVCPELKTRTLLMLGSESRMIHSAVSQAMEQMMPAIQTVVLQGAGHFAMVEQPEAAAGHFLGFVQGNSA